MAFGIARIYDEQLEDGATATTYYGEALEVLEMISTEATAWGAYMRVTTLGALAVCHENLYVAFARCVLGFTCTPLTFNVCSHQRTV